LTKSIRHLSYAGCTDRRDQHKTKARHLQRTQFVASIGGGATVNDQAVIRLRIGYSVLTLVVALVLAAWFVVPSGSANASADSFVGPATWPRAMLIGIALCSALLVLRNAVLYASAQRTRTRAEPPTDEFDNRKAVIGIVLLTLYVVAMSVIGFALATVAFFLVWLPYGGVRKPHVVASVAIVGTIALLYAFVKLTTLPLERGLSVFDSVTVALYRVLGIY
jgi:hypothetical protein